MNFNNFYMSETGMNAVSANELFSYLVYMRCKYDQHCDIHDNDEL